MRSVTLLSLCAAATLFSSCHKENTDDIDALGDLERQGNTTYMYGTHVLRNSKEYVLTSSTINLDLYVGKKVEITAYDKHYHVENGPILYEVTSIKEK